MLSYLCMIVYIEEGLTYDGMLKWYSIHCKFEMDISFAKFTCLPFIAYANQT